MSKLEVLETFRLLNQWSLTFNFQNGFSERYKVTSSVLSKITFLMWQSKLHYLSPSAFPKVPNVLVIYTICNHCTCPSFPPKAEIESRNINIPLLSRRKIHNMLTNYVIPPCSFHIEKAHSGHFYKNNLMNTLKSLLLT